MDSAVVKQRTTLWRRELRPVLCTSLPISVCSSWDQFLGDWAPRGHRGYSGHWCLVEEWSLIWCSYLSFMVFHETITLMCIMCVILSMWGHNVYTSVEVRRKKNTGQMVSQQVNLKVSKGHIPRYEVRLYSLNPRSEDKFASSPDYAGEKFAGHRKQQPPEWC